MNDSRGRWYRTTTDEYHCVFDERSYFLGNVVKNRRETVDKNPTKERAVKIIVFPPPSCLLNIHYLRSFWTPKRLNVTLRRYIFVFISFVRCQKRKWTFGDVKH